MSTRAFLLIFLLLSLSCSSPFEYHPSQIILEEGEQNLTKKNLSLLQEKEPSDTICFALISDTQRAFDELEDFSRIIDRQKDVEFIIHAGDISNFGLPEEFKWVQRSLEYTNIPYFTVIGNHDLLANGRKFYQQMFGPLNYSFDYGFVRFVMFDANSREYEFNGQVPDISWLKEQATPADAQIEQIIAVSHVPPFNADFDPTFEQDYARLLNNSSRFNLSLHGHEHSWSKKSPYGEEDTYLVVSNIGQREYAKIKIWKDDFSIEKISF